MVGEGGMTPQYFLHHLTLAEALDFLKGQDHRHREHWLMTKILSEVCAAPYTPEDSEPWMLNLPWLEDKPEIKPTTDEEREHLRMKATEFAERLKLRPTPTDNGIQS